MIDGYDWAGGREAMLRFGPADGPVVVAAMPLLEEWNRTRAFVMTLLRALADRGIGSVLPDLPGHGESLDAAGRSTVPQLSDAIAALTGRLRTEGRPTLAVGIRSGALLDGCGHLGRWHLAPTTGAEVLGDLHRTWLAAGMPPPGSRSLDAMMRGTTVAGTHLSADLLASLGAADHCDRSGIPRRVVRLSTDPRPADRKVGGAPLWRRTEPGNDPVLAALLAADIANWVATCAG